jgi:ribosomal protein S18 acetylase RimI-like enzyme
MSPKEFDLVRNRASATEIGVHLKACDHKFVPPLSERADLDEYAAKVVLLSERFEAWSGNVLVGLLAAYCNDSVRQMAFITNVSVLPSWHGRGIASDLLRDCLEHVREMNFKGAELSVDKHNKAAQALYMKHGFVVTLANHHVQNMHRAV